MAPPHSEAGPQLPLPSTPDHPLDLERPRRRPLEAGAPPDSMSSSVVPSLARSSSSSPRTGKGYLGGYLHVARKTLGISCLLLTVFLWTASNFLASSIFSDHTYDKPFFVVYVNTAMFAISLVPLAVKHVLQNGGFAHTKSLALQAWNERPPRAVIPDDEDEALASEALLMDEDGSNSSLEATVGEKAVERLTFRETAWLSFEFCMLWFIANYFASAPLEYTSVGSVTILTSTSSVWTLIFCAVMKVEGFTVRKLVGVLASLAGIVLISSMDLSGKDNDDDRGNFPHKTQQQIAIGDSMAFISAVVYGLYVTVMKVRVGNEERVNMPLFFGLVGIINVLCLWPLFIVLHLTGIETFELPPSGKVWTIILLNSVASFISDMSWAYAMLLTTPLIVTVGLSLTIPLSLIGEMFQYQQFASFMYWVGAGIVLLSFIFINHESHEEPQHDSGRPESASRNGSRPPES